MTEIIVLEDFSLASQGPTVSLGLAPGQSLALVGPASSGKSRLLRCLCGTERAPQGVVHVSQRPAAAGREGFSKRTKPKSIVGHVKSKKNAHVGEALTACGLWDSMQTPISSLSSSQMAACELLPCLAPDSRLLLIDGQLDRLDPWTLASVLDELRKRLASGAAVVVATNRPELLPQFDLVVVLDRSHILFAGKTEDLMRKAPVTEIEVESNLQQGVRAIVEPFRVSVYDETTRITFRAEPGQDIAARLLLEGYGDVEYVVTRPPTPEQALMHLTKSRPRQLKARVR